MSKKEMKTILANVHVYDTHPFHFKSLFLWIRIDRSNSRIFNNIDGDFMENYFKSEPRILCSPMAAFYLRRCYRKYR